ncbi:exocyst complex component Sec10-domain-containing protein [Lasiosphaeria miniovina]|uniref:Exocyst complex component Sec10-domain-containing protein n=1 Tax=Lasiosphaeria miniovina TaxID=1954250 RepID=A0AA40E6Y2_9PEZI|nr:exocyst complex component Sec10-domain-containing protein [Lasiosphaeria miniovina]KAK0727282.1 exocyst complex component Sec10-domain-containing protein [Lasiosphaeria miniovina]
MSNLRAPTARQAPQPSILQTLQATDMIESKPVLPAEILVAILDYLPVPDLMRFARASRRMREMVYDDTRWVARLRNMGCWDEAEARRRFDDAMKRRHELAAHAAAATATTLAPGATATGPTAVVGALPPPVSTTLFDASVEEERQKQLQQRRQRQMSQVRDGFETLQVSGGQAATPPKLPVQAPVSSQNDPSKDLEALLQVIKNVKSVRGHAREEYGKIYGALGPFYFDLAKARTHTDPIVFQVFRDPESQARMLANLRLFAKSDWSQGCTQREEKLGTMVTIFESAVLREFEQGYEFWDVGGRMRKYAHVLDILNGGNAGVELFIHKHPIFTDRDVLANPMDCVNLAPADAISLEPSRRFFDVLAVKVNAQAAIIERIFPSPGPVFSAFVEKVREDIVAEYTTPLFDETHERSIPSYLKAVSGLFEQTLQFFRALTPPKDTNAPQKQAAKEFALKLFEPHLDLYLQDELDYFTKETEHKVGEWEKKLSAQDTSVESFYMASFNNRQADKKDFLTSFKKVVMMPISVLPTSLSLPGLPMGSPFASSKPTIVTNGVAVSPQPSRPHSPSPSSLASTGTVDQSSSPLPGGKAPTDELAAKAALMTSRLEGIKSLFSIEVALSLVHSAKASLGRVAVFIQLGGQAGGEAREQCEAIFVTLLRILGGRHVKPGFDKAVTHLSQYNPREVSQHDKGGVAPLVTFIELVNVGDLISQMIDVFYEQQLAGPKIADRNDFLDPAGLAKKKFEQMLDESVAAGLNKGIDVLMDEVEYICATTQLPTDYNPGASSEPSSAGGGATATEKEGKAATPRLQSSFGGGAADFDIGPTATAQRVRDLVASHTNMLVGSTDKSMLDVFNGEVGLRLFGAVCKHLKRQRISTEGAIKLIADMNLHFEYIRTLKNNDLLAYFRALRELSQIYLIDARHAKEMATIIADGDRFGGIFRAEEVYEYAERRSDWYQVRKDVERAMYGRDCVVM